MSTLKKMLIFLVLVFGMSACSFTEPTRGFCDHPDNKDHESCQNTSVAPKTDDGVTDEEWSPGRVETVNKPVSTIPSLPNDEEEEDEENGCDPQTDPYCMGFCDSDSVLEEGTLVEPPRVQISVSTVYNPNDRHDSFLTVSENNSRYFRTNGNPVFSVKSCEACTTDVPSTEEYNASLILSPVAPGESAAYGMEKMEDSFDLEVDADGTLGDNVRWNVSVVLVKDDCPERRFYYGTYTSNDGYMSNVDMEVEDQPREKPGLPGNLFCDNGHANMSQIYGYQEPSTEFTIVHTPDARCN